MAAGVVLGAVVLVVVVILTEETCSLPWVWRTIILTSVSRLLPATATVMAVAAVLVVSSLASMREGAVAAEAGWLVVVVGVWWLRCQAVGRQQPQWGLSGPLR